MSNVAVLGYSGFVGFHIYQNLPDADIYNSTNLADIHNKQYDDIYCACIPAMKWKANQDPVSDKDAIQSIQNHLSNVKCNRFILVSTIDIHDHCVSHQTEDPSTWTISKEPYGKHRFEFEAWVKQQSNFKEVYIIRLPALFGIGLKKNVIYDLLHQHRLEYIHLYDEYQWYSLRWLWDDIQRMLSMNLPYLHTYTTAISNLEIISTLFPHLLPRIDQNVDRDKIVYCQSTQYTSLQRDKAAIMNDLKIFKQICQLSKDKIAISSLHWKPCYDTFASIILDKFGIHNIELVPWNYLTPSATVQEIHEIKRYWSELGMHITSLQAILFGVQGSIATNQQAIIERCHQVGNIADVLGATKVVFGAPKLRAEGNASDLHDILRGYTNTKTILCIEHVAQDYGNRVGVKLNDLCPILDHGQTNIGINFDLGNAYMENDSIQEHHIPHIKHVQVSMPHLHDMDASILKRYHDNATYLQRLLASECMITMEVQSNVNKLSNNIYTFLAWLSEYLLPDRKDALIIGCGWYGCHVANLLEKRDCSFDMIDKTNSICTASSIKNQNRLHLGFHYPRSHKTRMECKLGFTSFQKEYCSVLETFDNFYFVAKTSLVDFHTYCGIMNHDQIKYEIASWADIHPVSMNPAAFDGMPIRVDECFINPFKVQEYFNTRFEQRLISINDVVIREYKTVFDCTYGHLFKNEDCFHEQCITFLIHMKVYPTRPIGITIMDGPFFSIYPYDIDKNLYTLTHVSYTPRSTSMSPSELYELMCKDVRQYIKNYDDLFSYHAFYLSTKTKRKDAYTDDRSVEYKHIGNVHSFMGGKITGIFEIDDCIDDILKHSNTTL